MSIKPTGHRALPVNPSGEDQIHNERRYRAEVERSFFLTDQAILVVNKIVSGEITVGADLQTFVYTITDDAGDGSVWDDANNTDFTGQTGADGQCAQVPASSLVYFSHKGSIYIWSGSKPASIGLGCGDTAVEADFTAFGTATNWDDIIGKPSTFPPSPHTHPWTEITNKPTTFPPSAHTHVEADITDLDRVRWKGAWAPGSYVDNDLVRDGSWTMVANKATTEKPAPTPVGPLVSSLPDTPAFTTNQHIGHVQTGSRFVFTETGLVTAIDVWVPEDAGDIEYRLVAVSLLDPENPFGVTIPATGLTPGQWNTVTSPTVRVPIAVGNEYLVLLDAVNYSETTNWEYSWQYTGNSNQAPASTVCNHTANQTTLKLHKTSLSGDAAASLGEVVTGSRITLTDPLNLNKYFEYSVFSVLDQGTYLQFGVNLLTTGPAGGPAFPAPTTVSAVIPVHDLTEYVELIGGNPTQGWVVTEGSQWFDGVEQPGNAANAYGVRIKFQPAYISPDWELVAYTGAVSSTPGGGASTFLELSDTPPVYTGAANKVVTVKDDETGLEFRDSTGGASTGSTPPANPANGDLWYRTTGTPGLYVWYDDGDSGQWVQTNGGSAPELPIGYVWTSFSATNPAVVLGYGTWAATAEGRVLVGVGNAGGRTWNARDEAGADQAQLSVSNLPAHTHPAGTLQAASNGSHSHDMGYGNDVTSSGGSGNTLRTTGNVRTKNDGAHTHSITGNTASQGTDTPFDIIQPSVALYMFERIA